MYQASEVYANEILRRFNEINRLAAVIVEITNGLQADSSNLTNTNKARILEACNTIQYQSR